MSRFLLLSSKKSEALLDGGQGMEEGAPLEPQAQWDDFQPFLWRVTNLDERLLSLAQSLDQFYKNSGVDGSVLSEERRREELQQIENQGASGGLNFAYGEILFDTFLEYLNNTVVQYWKDGPKIFLDLGSGTGKDVFAVHLGFQSEFKSSIGIELIPELSAAASQLLSELTNSNPIR